MRAWTVFALLLMGSLAFAGAPSRHTLSSLEYLSDYNGIDEVATLCSNYQREFIAGAVCTDFTVDLYVVENGRGYLVMHNWNTQQRIMTQAVNDAERCLAHGASAHLIQDSIWHNNIIPDAITSSGFRNIPYHPLYELQDELYLQRTDRQTVEIMKRACTLFEEKPRYSDMFQNALGQQGVTNINVKERMKVMANLMGTDTFYGGSGEFSGYKNNIFYGIAQVAASAIQTYPADQITGGQEATNRMHQIYASFGDRFTCDDNFCPANPHGFESLEQADAGAGYTQIIVIGSLLGAAL